MDVKFLVKNVSHSDGIYRAHGQDIILKKGQQVYLDFPPEFASAELKIIQMGK